MFRPYFSHKLIMPFLTFYHMKLTKNTALEHSKSIILSSNRRRLHCVTFGYYWLCNNSSQRIVLKTYQPFLWTYNKDASLSERIAADPSSFTVP